MRTRNFLRSCWHGLVGRTPAYLFGAIFTAGLAFSLTTYAVHDIDVFELDNSTTGANAIDETLTNNADAGMKDDWARNNFPNLGQCFDLNGVELNINSCGYVSGPNVDPENPGGSAFRSLFIQDPNGVGNNDDIFTGGGSKDDLDVSQWQWTFGSAPDKDDLLPIGAAAYLEDLDADNEDELLIYLFGTLFAPNGSAAIGAWLFKKDIGTCADGSFGVVDDEDNCIANQPSELHTVGDVFVVSETTNGGRAVQMQVFKWVGDDAAEQAACVTDGGTLEPPKNSLCKVLDETNALCTDGLTGDDACGSMNLGTVKQGQVTFPGSPTESPDDWGFMSKFPPPAGAPNPPGTDGIQSNDFPETSLFEAGFNFSNLFGDEIGCFNSFLMNTRSSHEVRAQLKDLALGAFPLCGIKVEKTGDTLGKVGDPVDYTITVTNTGAITLSRDSIIDDVLGDLADPANPYVTNSTCGATLAAGASCVIEATRTVLAGDPDPLPNTVVVVYSSGEDEQTAEASHEVNLFQPAVLVDKSGDTLSKVGDPVDYTIVVTNDSSDDSPDLVNGTIVDTLLGDLLAANPYVTNSDCGTTLATGASCTINATRTVQAGDSDPLPNTVTVHYNPDGFPNDISASDDHSVNLFQPSVTIDKTGTELSKVTDDVDYVITVNNTSSDDSPNLVCDITDSLLGTLVTDVNLASGEEYVINASRTVQQGDPDPLVNTATVTCSPEGFPNELTDSDSHSTNLFQPSVNLVKTGDELSKATDDVTYTITLNNTSSGDSPDLECTISDLMLGLNKQVTLASGASDVTNVPYTVLVGDPDPLLNTASASCSPIGFPNVLDASDGHSINLFQPSVTIDKTADCDVLGVPVGADITYSYVINNTSSTDSPALNLASIVDDVLGDLATEAIGAGCDSLASGASCNFTKVVNSASLPFGVVFNTVDVLYNPAGFPNAITASDSHSCEIVLPNPATVVIEKVLLNAENVVFDYNDVNAGQAGSFQLTPLFGTLQHPASPFPAAGAGNGFATTDEITVEIPDVTQTEQYSVTEVLPLPQFISFDSLECEVTLNNSGSASVNPEVPTQTETANLTLGSGDFAFCRYVNEFIPGEEGCTPGYWKQPQHFGSWTNPPYDPFTTQLQDVFNFSGVNGQIGGLADDLMLDALSYPGGTGKLGAAQILLRAAVAAVLNASHSGVQYAFTEAQVIALVDAQLAGGSRETMLALATDLDQANNGVFNDNGATESCPLGLNPLP